MEIEFKRTRVDTQSDKIRTRDMLCIEGATSICYFVLRRTLSLIDLLRYLTFVIEYSTL